MRTYARTPGIGIAACAGIAWILTSLLFGVSPYDQIAFSAVPLVLIAVAWLATRVPAEPAAKLDPMTALRCE